MKTQKTETPSPIKIANIDLQCKEHNFKDVEEYFEKRWDSPGIRSIRDLNKRGFNIKLFQLTRNNAKTIKKEHIEIELIKAQPFFYPNKKRFNYNMYSKKLEKKIKEFKPQLLHINQNSGNNLYKLVKFSLKNEISYIIHFRGGNLNNFNKKRSFIFLHAKKIIVNNSIQKKHILDIFPNLNEKIEIIPLGIDLTFFKDLKKEKELLTFGYTGRIYEHKGLLEALEFIKFIKNTNENVKFYIAGNFETEKYKSLFWNRVKEFNLTENVIFEGYLTGEKLVNFYNKFNFLLFLSKHESFGKSVVEAMACGVIPIIRKNSDGPEDIIENGKHGFILPEKNVWNNFINHLIDKKLLNDLKKKIIKRANNFSFNQYIEKLKQIYLNTYERF